MDTKTRSIMPRSEIIDGIGLIVLVHHVKKSRHDFFWKSVFSRG